MQQCFFFPFFVDNNSFVQSNVDGGKRSLKKENMNICRLKVRSDNDDVNNENDSICVVAATSARVRESG